MEVVGQGGPSMTIRATKANIAETATSQGRVLGWPGRGASTKRTESERGLLLGVAKKLASR